MRGGSDDLGLGRLIPMVLPELVGMGMTDARIWSCEDVDEGGVRTSCWGCRFVGSDCLGLGLYDTLIGGGGWAAAFGGEADDGLWIPEVSGISLSLPFMITRSVCVALAWTSRIATSFPLDPARGILTFCWVQDRWDAPVGVSPRHSTVMSLLRGPLVPTLARMRVLD